MKRLTYPFLFFAAIMLGGLLLSGATDPSLALAPTPSGTPPIIILVGSPTPTATPTPRTGKWVLERDQDGFQIWVWQETTPQRPAPTPTITPIIVVIQPTPCVLDAVYVADVTIPDYSPIAPGVGFNKTWRVRNTGPCDWGEGVGIRFVSGAKLDAPNSLSVMSIGPGATTDINVPMRAPESAGTYTGVWQLVDPQGQPFGEKLTVVIEVPAPATPTATAPPAPPPKQFSAQLVRWWPNCGISLVKGKIVEPNGDPVNGLRVRVWADGWDGALSLVSGVGLTYGPGEWDVLLRQGQSGKFYVAVWDWQTGPESYARVDSDVLELDFNYTQENCQPEADGHQVAEVRFVRNY